MRAWHQRTIAESLEELATSVEQGLSQSEAKSRQERYGTNELVASDGRGPWKILWDQLSGAMVWLLIAATLVSLFLQEYTDAIVIMAIVLLNAALGFFQDYRAERALAALKKLAVPTVRVRRDGVLQERSARELVPGDIVFLEVGNAVPADCRLIESINLKAQEAALTGESASVIKQTSELQDEDLPVAERSNMAYLGTTVTYGHGQAVVTATGMDTELGQIAHSLQDVDTEPTPLQTKLAQLGRSLALLAVGIVALVFVIGLIRGEDTRLMLLTALSLAVAVVPEGLPAVATVALALGAKRMLGKNALIRKLPAVETLGSVTVICSDKTGTLTQNKMTVTFLDVAGAGIDVSGIPNNRAGGTSDGIESGEFGHVADNPAVALLMTGAGLCNDVEMQSASADSQLMALGEPTEIALVLAAERLGLKKSALARILPREAELPFDSDRKRMTTIHRVSASIDDELSPLLTAALEPITALNGDYFAFTKGAADSILPISKFVWDGDTPQPMDEQWKRRIQAGNERMAGAGMRVLGVAFRPLDVPADASAAAWLSGLATHTEASEAEAVEMSLVAQELEQDLIFVGLIGMIDPPRPEAAKAVEQCQSAGVRPIMITGDHPLTASYIARELDIARNDKVITGQEIEMIDQAELGQVASTASVYARVAPKHKMRLVKALQDSGHIVAMTGDGVNDAPALKQAHIGIAMGITGTDVSKEASQMVLLDDNFATIVQAVEEGRVVYDNIRKFVKYTMTSNAGETLVMLLGPLAGAPLPLLPLQILWVNLVTDGLPGLALALEKAEEDTMSRPPHPPEEHVFGRGMAWDIAWIGSLMGLISFAPTFWFWPTEPQQETLWRTVIFTVLTLSQLGNALASRSDRDSIFKIGVASNPAMLGSVCLTLFLQILVIYWPPLQAIFETTSLTAGQLLVCLLLSTIVFWAVELQKMAMLWRRNHGEKHTR